MLELDLDDFNNTHMAGIHSNILRDGQLWNENRLELLDLENKRHT